MHPATILAACLASLTGFVSLLSCVCVLLEAGADWRGGESKIVTRIQFFFQIPLLLFSCCYLFKPLLSTGFFGNEFTCQLQGFLLQFSVSAILLIDMMLSLSYVLMIKIQVQEELFRRAEKYVHTILWPSCLVPAVVLWSKRAYRIDSAQICWLGGCENCLEMDATDYTRSAVYVLVALHLFFSFYAMAQVYRFAMNRSSSQAAQIMARKGLAYAGSILVLQLPRLFMELLTMLGYSSRTVTALDSSTSVLIGVTNMLVFIMYRRKMRTLYGRIVRQLVDCVACCRPKNESLEQAMSRGRDLFLSSNVMESRAEAAHIEPICSKATETAHVTK